MPMWENRSNRRSSRNTTPQIWGNTCRITRPITNHRLTNLRIPTVCKNTQYLNYILTDKIKDCLFIELDFNTIYFITVLASHFKPQSIQILQIIKLKNHRCLLNFGFLDYFLDHMCAKIKFLCLGPIPLEPRWLIKLLRADWIFWPVWQNYGSQQRRRAGSDVWRCRL